jgi:hypothetical protein
MKEIQKPLCKQPVTTPERRYRTFEDLEVYKAAREFRKAMYPVNRRLPNLALHESFPAYGLSRNDSVGNRRKQRKRRLNLSLLRLAKLAIESSFGEQPQIHKTTPCHRHPARRDSVPSVVSCSTASFRLSEEELDGIFNDPAAPTASTLQRFNASTNKA